jgi:hypothetical protein
VGGDRWAKPEPGPDGVSGYNMGCKSLPNRVEHYHTPRMLMACIRACEVALRHAGAPMPATIPASHVPDAAFADATSRAAQQPGWRGLRVGVSIRPIGAMTPEPMGGYWGRAAPCEPCDLQDELSCRALFFTSVNASAVVGLDGTRANPARACNCPTSVGLTWVRGTCC